MAINKLKFYHGEKKANRVHFEINCSRPLCFKKLILREICHRHNAVLAKLFAATGEFSIAFLIVLI